MSNINKMNFITISGAILGVLILLYIFCFKSVATDPGYESVIVDKPLIFGTGGVRDEVQKPGRKWYWTTTELTGYSTFPIRYNEPLEHLATSDNNFINYQSFIVLQWYDFPQMVRDFGYDKWYENNLQEQYRTIVRDVTKKYQMTEIMTGQTTLELIEGQIAMKFREHIATTGLHVRLLNVNMGKALPNPSVIAEMDNTAIQQQSVKTQNQRKLSEDARKEAETSRAAADNAYRNDMNLDPNQFIQLEAIKRYSDACRETKGCVIVQGNAPVLVGK